MVSVDIGLADLTLNLAQTNVKLTHTKPRVCILATPVAPQISSKSYGFGTVFSGFGVGFGVEGGAVVLFEVEVFEFAVTSEFAFEFELLLAAEFELLFDLGLT